MDSTIYFLIGLCLGCFLGGVLGFAVCAVLAIGGDDDAKTD
jgi:hypothetical protein